MQRTALFESMTIKNLIKVEELAMFILGTLAFMYFGGTLWAFLLTLFLPDLSMIGYLISPFIGAITYNFIHFKGLAVCFFILGMAFNLHLFIFAGLILFAHSSLDRFLGYGLKYKDRFENTSLGEIGKKNSKI